MRPLQSISLLILCVTAVMVDAASLQPHAVARLTFHDVDGNTLSTADGHVTIITVVTRQNEEQAHSIADQVPERCVADPKFRYVTLVNFQRKLAAPFQGLTRVIIRQRLDAEAQKLRPEYQQKKISRDPRKDMFVVADFDGSAVSQLGLLPDSNDVAVFVFNGHGKLIQNWAGVPPNDSLPGAIAAAE
ncbi:MAG: hypothetical protein ACJ8LI_07565 [Chthoniobacterales bacterium]